MEKYSANPMTMKRINSDATLDAIRQNPGVTKPQISKLIGLSLPTVNKLVAELESEQYVISGDTVDSGGGRPARTYYFNENRNYVVSVYIANGAYYISVSNSENYVLSKETVKHEDGEDWTEELCSLLEVELHRFAEKKIKAIAVAVPGTVNDGVLHNIPTIPEWEGVNLKAFLVHRFGLTVVVENDIKAVTMGIYDKYKQQSQIENMVFLYIDAGIGAGIRLDGKLYRSRKNFSGELAFLKTGNGKIEQALQNAPRTLLFDICSDVINNIICMLEPDLIAIACKWLQPRDLDVIRKRLKDSISECYIPEFVLEQIDDNNFSRGLTISAIELVDKMLRIV